MKKKYKFKINKIGLAFGTFFAIIHAVWSILVATIPAGFQDFLDWVFMLHSLKPLYILTPFNLANGVVLIIITFVFGYAFGWCFATVLKWVNKHC